MTLFALIPCLIAAALIMFLAWALCRISSESTERAERMYEAWLRRRP